MPRLQNNSKYWVSRRVVECIQHVGALVRRLLYGIHDCRRRYPCGLEDRRRDIDHVTELRPDLALCLDALGPLHDRAVAGAAKVRRHLLGPLIGRIHRMRPAHGVMVVGFWTAEVVDLAHQEFSGLEIAHAVEHGHLVEAAVRRSLGGGAIVSEDVVDQRVVEDFQFLQGIEQPADVMVGMFEEPGVDLHLATEDSLEFLRHVVEGGDFGRTFGEDGIGRNHTELLLTGKGLFAQPVPTAGT